MSQSANKNKNKKRPEIWVLGAGRSTRRSGDIFVTANFCYLGMRADTSPLHTGGKRAPGRAERSTYCEGVGFVDNSNEGRRSPEEKVWERVLDCLSLGLCQLFECFTPH